MKKNILILGFIIMGFVLHSCKKDDNVQPPKNNQNNQPVKVVMEDTMVRMWTVDSAFHNGSPDYSSEGLEMDIYKNGTYLLVSQNFNGTWEFTDTFYTDLLFDKNTPQYKTLMKIKSLTSCRLHVTFKSPFTGGSAEWILKSKE